MNRLIASGSSFRLRPSIVHAVRDCCCQRRLKGPIMASTPSGIRGMSVTSGRLTPTKLHTPATGHVLRGPCQPPVVGE